jgi:phosphoglycerate transporter family protein
MSVVEPRQVLPLEYAGDDETARRYRHFRPRILLWSIVGYAMYYFVRKNLSVAMPVMEAQLGVSKAQLGLFLTLHGLLYGVSKFVNGMIGDRVNARLFMALGLLLSAAMNFAFGLSSTALALGVFWMLNGWFQGIGFPPCARLMTHWFHPRELATKMSVWNMSHGIGAGAVVILCGYLVDHYNDWRLCFFVPAALAVVAALLLFGFLRDTPESVGLPPVAGTSSDAPDATEDRPRDSFRTILVNCVFTNRYIWLLAIANFFVYTIRYALLDWGPTMLKEYKHVELRHGGWMVAAFEAAGLLGTLTMGWLTDRVFGGRGARTCVFCMLLCAAAVLAFWRAPSDSRTLYTVMLMFAGFFIYGPQALVGIAAANLATKKAAATAVGLTGLFGYASTILSGWGLGLLVQTRGWQAAFQALLVIAAIGVVLFLLAWNAPRDGYAQTPSSA